MKRQPELEPVTSTFTFAAKKAKLRGIGDRIKGDNQKRKQPQYIVENYTALPGLSSEWAKPGVPCMDAKKADRKHCFLPLKRGKSMWLSLVRSVPLYSLHNQVCHMDFSRSLISSG